MHSEIILSGFGGQGIMFAGQIMSYAAMDSGREVTWIPSYGPEMRGGTFARTDRRLPFNQKPRELRIREQRRAVDRRERLHLVVVEQRAACGRGVADKTDPARAGPGNVRAANRNAPVVVIDEYGVAAAIHRAYGKIAIGERTYCLIIPYVIYC